MIVYAAKVGQIKLLQILFLPHSNIFYDRQHNETICLQPHYIPINDYPKPQIN